MKSKKICLLLGKLEETFKLRYFDSSAGIVYYLGQHEFSPNMVVGDFKEPIILNGSSIELLLVPTEYALHPAYPNPFNPVTTISYDLPKDSEISLTVYDVEGRKINTLSQGLKSAGSHSEEWSANGLPSGVYFIKLDAEQFIQTQKVVVIK